MDISVWNRHLHCGVSRCKKKPEHPRRKWIGSEILFVSKMWQQPSSVHNSKQHPFLGGSTTQGFWHQYPSWLVLIWVNLRCRHTCANTLARDRKYQDLCADPGFASGAGCYCAGLNIGWPSSVSRRSFATLSFNCQKITTWASGLGFMTIFVSLFTTCICMDICCSTDHITSQQREDVEKSRGSRSDFPTIKR